MKFIMTILFPLITLSIVTSLAFAAGDVERGKALFNDPKLGTNGSTCGTCHPNGKGLENSGEKEKTEWKTPGGIHKSLEEAINMCITMALKGTARDNKSQDMQDLVAYINSLGKEAPKKKRAAGY